MSGRSKLATMLAVTALVAAPIATASAATEPAGPALAKKLAQKVTTEGVNRHLIAFQRLADRNGGNRAALTPGYDASVDYVANKLRDEGFIVSTPTFDFDIMVTDAELARVDGVNYQALIMSESPQTPVGGVTGPLRVVPEDTTTGCEATDFAGQDFTGSVALIRRGGCTFEQKHLNAFAAGAVAVLVSNNVAGPLSNVTLTNPGKIPTGGVSQADGTTLAGRRRAAWRSLRRGRDLWKTCTAADVSVKPETRGVVSCHGVGGRDPVVSMQRSISAVSSTESGSSACSAAPTPS